MTFESAVNNLSNGKAAKLTSWGGYVFRTDTTSGISAWADDHGQYSVGDLVTYNGNTYICKIQHTPTSGGSFDSSKWTSTSKYILTFRKRSNVEGSPSDVAYTWTPTIVNGSIVYSVEPDGSPSTEFDTMLKMDGSLFIALLSNDWIVGYQTDFETSRTGAGKIW